MLIRRLISLLVICSILGGSGAFVRAQQQSPRKEDSEKIKTAAQELEKNALEMLEEVVVAAAALKLPENRALIYTTVGDTLWLKDEKRARGLFRAAAGEIVQAMNTKVEKPEQVRINETQFGRQEIVSLRQTILRTLAERDAEMALELLQVTRAPDVAAEMAGYVMPTPSGAVRNPNDPPLAPRNYKVEQEIRLEESLTAKAAGQDPQKAAQRIRSILEKGFSPEILQALQRLYSKDAELAAKLLSELVQKLLAADLSKNNLSMNFALNLLRSYTVLPKANPGDKNPARLTIDDKSVKDIANKIADALMKATDYKQNAAFNNALPILQKIVPERVAPLNQKQAALKKQAAASTPTNRAGYAIPQAPSSLNDPNASPEKLLADALKAPVQYRSALYRQAAARALAGDPEKIRALLLNQPESRERNDALLHFDAAIISSLIQKGKIDEARRFVDRMPFGAARAEQIVQLALAAYRANQSESKDAALLLLEEARQMIKEFPEDRDEVDGLLKVAAGFAVVETERAFAMLPPVIEQANEVIGAQAVLARYNKQTQTFRDGEMMMASNFGALNTTVFRYGRELKLLARHDFGRTRGLIEQFRREDVRLFVKLFVAQSILRERIGISPVMNAER